MIFAAITVWQPWASLIVIGAKPYEFRGRKPPAKHVGNRIAVHAGARPVKPDEIVQLIQKLGARDVCLKQEIAFPFLERVLDGEITLPTSHVLATAILGEGKRGDECARELGIAIGGNDSDREGTFNYGWPLTDIQPLVPPVPARGSQGWWSFTA
jgi:hypothetical protein